MNINFPAFYESSSQSSFNIDEMKRKLEPLLTKRPWAMQTTTDANILITVGMNWSSWGEVITITPGHDHNYVVRSQCRYPFQCFDWDKNKSNVFDVVHSISSAT